MYKEQYRITIGIASYGCFDPNINFGAPMKIGNYCSFATNVHFIPGNHPPQDVSTHPYFHRPEYGFVNARSSGCEAITMVVGHDVWIGRDVVLLPKCKTIGNGAVIGAGSVVTHDVEPYSIIAGNPAKEIRKRFSEKEISKLEQSRWYELTPKQLSSAFRYADNIDLFVKEVNRINRVLDIKRTD